MKWSESLQGGTEPKAREFFLLRLKKFKSPIFEGGGRKRALLCFFLSKKEDGHF